MSNDPAARLHRFRSLIGRAPDSEIAAEIGVTVEDVKAYRRANKINPYLRPAPGVAPPTMAPDPRAEAAAAPEDRAGAIAASGPAADQGAPALPVTRAPEPAAESAAHPLEAYRDQLGKVSDDVIAGQAGVKTHVVGEFRRAAGIAAYTGYRFVPGHAPRRGPIRREEPAGSAPEAPSRAGVPAAETPAPPVSAARTRAPRERARETVAAEVHGVPTGVARLEAGALGVRFTLPPSAADQRRSVGGGATRVVRPVASPAATTATPAPSLPVPRATSDEQTFKNGKLTAFRHLIGVEPDAVVAARANATAGGVKKYRERHGIAAPVAAPVVTTPAPVAAPTTQPPRPSKLDAHRDIVGVLTDAAVAAIAGVTREGVRQFRKRHGIRSAQGGQEGVDALASPRAGVRRAPPVNPVAALPAEVAPAPQAAAPAAEPAVTEPVAEAAAPAVQQAQDAAAAAPAAAKSSLRFAFRVLAESGEGGRRFIVVGEHIGEAAMAAVRALGERADGPWTVKLVKVLEEALS